MVAMEQNWWDLMEKFYSYLQRDVVMNTGMRVWAAMAVIGVRIKIGAITHYQAVLALTNNFSYIFARAIFL